MYSLSTVFCDCDIGGSDGEMMEFSKWRSMRQLRLRADYARDESGGAAVEYALLIAMIALTAAAGMSSFGNNLSSVFASVGAGLGGAGAAVPGAPGTGANPGPNTPGGGSGPGAPGGSGPAAGGSGGSGPAAGGSGGGGPAAGGSGGGGSGGGGSGGGGSGGGGSGAGAPGTGPTAGVPGGGGSGSGGSQGSNQTGSGFPSNPPGGGQSPNPPGSAPPSNPPGGGYASNQSGGGGQGPSLPGGGDSGGGPGGGPGGAPGGAPGNGDGTPGDGDGGSGDGDGAGASQMARAGDRTGEGEAVGAAAQVGGEAPGALDRFAAWVDGLVSPSSLPNRVEENNAPPSVQIVRPSVRSTVSGEVAVRVRADDREDPLGALAVEVSTDGGASWNKARFTTSMLYEYRWQTPAGVDGAAYKLVARATDRGSATARSEPVVVSVDNVGVASLASTAR